VQINQQIIIFSGCYIKAKTPTCHMVLENPEKSIQSPRKSNRRVEIRARARISFGFRHKIDVDDDAALDFIHIMDMTLSLNTLQTLTIHSSTN
jgi:hypothetical protein